MNLTGYFKDLFGVKPKGSVFTVDDIAFDHGRYQHHIDRARNELRSMLFGKHALVLKDVDGAVNPAGLLSKVRWTYQLVIAEWVEDEFISKIRRFSAPCGALTAKGCNYAPEVKERDGDPLHNGIEHLKASKPHADRMVAAISFFLCDERSPFDKKRSLYDGDCTPSELTHWYIGGLDIVRRNIGRIEAYLNKVVGFIQENTRR